MIALQLNPPLVVSTPLGDGWAHVLVDYGPNFNPVYVIELESGDFKNFSTNQIKSCGNKTFEFKRGQLYKNNFEIYTGHDCFQRCMVCDGKGEVLRKEREFGGYAFEACPACSQKKTA